MSDSVMDGARRGALYVVESRHGDALWSGFQVGQANTMQAALERLSPGCELVVYDVVLASRRPAKEPT